MSPKPIFSAVCPCCAGTVVSLRYPEEIDRESGLTRTVPLRLEGGHRIGPVMWACDYCGFSLLGLAVPASNWHRCIHRSIHEARECTEVYR